MSLSWLLFANLSVLGLLLYNTCFKLGGGNISAFAFALIQSGVQLVIMLVVFLVARYGFKLDVFDEIKSRGIGFAALAGLSVALIDVTFFLAFRYGSAVLTNTYCNVASTVLFAIICLAMFKEVLTIKQGVGIALGLASLILVTI